jgi:hypothetical protein
MLKPGRELDALVAEKVMMRGKLLVVSDEILDVRVAPGAVVHRQTPPTLEVPAYSTDIAAAWEVAKAIRSMRYNGSFLDFSIAQMDRVENGEWWVETGRVYENRAIEEGREIIMTQRVSVHAESAPHAICLAALKAVGAA